MQAKGVPKKVQQWVQSWMDAGILILDNHQYKHTRLEDLYRNSPSLNGLEAVETLLSEIENYQKKGWEGICQFPLLNIWRWLQRNPVSEDSRELRLKLWSLTALNVQRTENVDLYTLCDKTVPDLETLDIDEQQQVLIRLVRLYIQQGEYAKLKEVSTILQTNLTEEMNWKRFPMLFEFGYVIGMRGSFKESHDLFTLANTLVCASDNKKYQAHSWIGLGLSNQWFGRFFICPLLF